MEITKNEKTFDAVNMMREIRDKISQETQDMTIEQLQSYIKGRLTESKAKLVGLK